jgi:hypothetical protein
VARGYLNRPELTAERFVQNPFDESGQSRLYRTGDVARYDRDGNVHLVGRADSQVKLRGFRIELQEIEAALSRSPMVKDVAVILREDTPGDKRLAAYWVPSEDAASDDGASVVELRAWLRERLPEYMIPSAWVEMDALPHLPNGKVARNALPVPGAARPELAEEYVEPASDLERSIATAWREVLDVERVGKYDNFFDLGGNSLMILRVHKRLRSAYDGNLPVVKLFEHPTVASLATFMGEAVEQPSALQKAEERARRKRERRRERGRSL